MKNLTKSIKVEIKKIEEMFQMGLITPQEKHFLIYSANKSLRMYRRMTTN